MTFTSTVVQSPATTTFTAEVGKVMSNQETLIQSSTTSSTSLVASSTSLVTNQPVTFFAIVSSAGSIAGTVTFENHGAPIAGCTGRGQLGSHHERDLRDVFCGRGVRSAGYGCVHAGPWVDRPRLE